MAYITKEDANAWTDQTKLLLDDLDDDLLTAQAVQTLAGVSPAYDTTTWTDDSNTPKLVKQIIAMLYVGWFYEKTYSEDDTINSYGLMLIASANKLITSIASGLTLLPDAPTGTATDVNGPVFYPTDGSSSLHPNHCDMSLGGPVFSMGTIW